MLKSIKTQGIYVYLFYINISIQDTKQNACSSDIVNGNLGVLIVLVESIQFKNQHKN